MQRTFDTPTPTDLYVELGSGALTIHTDDVAKTVVDINGREADDVTVELRGDQLVILAPRRSAGFFRNNNDLDVHVSMPSDSRLATKLGSADVAVMGRLGDAAVKSGSGDISVEEVAGEALVETGSGDVQLGRVGGNLRVKAGSGDIRIDRIGGEASVSTGSGDVELGAASGGVQVKSGSGDLRVREAHDDLDLSTASGDLVVDRMHRGALRASNVSGDIQVGVPAGIPVWTDISSVTGSVRSNLEGAGQPEDGQDFIELRAKTVSGDVYLEQL
jgi:DUF4097 and DUF4098 domain-containing protein YvlB